MKGAAVGALIGEIASNDPGKGAAWGAAVGGIAARRRGTQAQQQATQQVEQQGQQAQAATAEQIQNFKKAFSVCLEAKDYLVKFWPAGPSRLIDVDHPEMFGIAAEYGTGDSEKPVRGIGELEPDRSGGAPTGDEVGVVVGDGIGDRGRRVHKPDGRSDHPLQRRPEQRIVGAAEDQRPHPGLPQRDGEAGELGAVGGHHQLVEPVQSAQFPHQVHYVVAHQGLAAGNADFGNAGSYRRS